MQSYTMTEQDKIFLYVDNKGTQPKYKQMGYWYKINSTGAEGYAEEVCSLILSHAKLPEGVNYVSYERCKIDNRYGCRSANFLNDGETYISFATLYKNVTNKELSEEVFKLPTISERFSFVTNFIKDVTGIDASNYLKAVTTLDALTLNPDRHFGNLGLIRCSNGDFRIAPIFDNGQALGCNYQITPPDLTIDEIPEKLSAATFSGSFVSVLRELGPGLTISYKKLNDDLEKKYPPCRITELLKAQLKLYQNLLDEELLSEKTNDISDIDLD